MAAPFFPDVETEAQKGMRVTQGHVAISGRGAARSQAPRFQPKCPHSFLELSGRKAPACGPPLRQSSPLRIVLFLGSDNAAHPTDTSLRPQRLQARVVLCSQGHEQGMSPTPRALGSHTHHGTQSLGDRHMHLGQVQMPMPRNSSLLGHFWKPPLPEGQY